jgi:hypothetical protein
VIAAALADATVDRARLAALVPFADAVATSRRERAAVDAAVALRGREIDIERRAVAARGDEERDEESERKESNERGSAAHGCPPRRIVPDIPQRRAFA